MGILALIRHVVNRYGGNKHLSGLGNLEGLLFRYWAKHVLTGIDLMERVLEEVATYPRPLGVVKSFFSLVLMLGDACQRAFRMLPEKRELVSRPSWRTYWFGILLTKTGYSEQAVEFFRQIENMVWVEPSARSTPLLSKPGAQPMLALALAGLALIRQDRERAAQAVKATRQSLPIRNVAMGMYPALLDLLIEEPGRDILLPIREMLDSRRSSFLAHTS